MSKFTPGPWVAEPDEHDFRVRSENWGTICYRNCYPNPEVDTAVEADARLIASAPALLEALYRLMSEGTIQGGIWRVDLSVNSKALTEVRAAIQQATGGDPS